ncbi:hypothetical protein LIER_14374 [Lithospermum erythrorhizon]|uniref:Zinc knuckle CX2CX4HX4C domain-containing protein n=1 Tax=Lithospermum erythrorhizon TaxID=34254 RepID=A0AAV3Q0W6_LITER
MFSKIGSYIGVAGDKKLPKMAPLMDENGVEFQQRIEYKWILPCYSHCAPFGHDLEHCRHGGKPLVVEEVVVLKGREKKE